MAATVGRRRLTRVLGQAAQAPERRNRRRRCHVHGQRLVRKRMEPTHPQVWNPLRLGGPAWTKPVQRLHRSRSTQWHPSRHPRSSVHPQTRHARRPMADIATVARAHRPAAHQPQRHVSHGASALLAMLKRGQIGRLSRIRATPPPRRKFPVPWSNPAAASPRLKPWGGSSVAAVPWLRAVWRVLGEPAIEAEWRAFQPRAELAQPAAAMATALERV